MRGLKDILAVIFLVALAMTLAFGFLTADPEMRQLFMLMMDSQ